MLVCINKEQAIDIAIQFFKQYHNKVHVSDIILEDDIWEITVSIGSVNNHVRKVGIDINNGKIRCYV